MFTAEVNLISRSGKWKKEFQAPEEELLETDRKHVLVTPDNKLENRNYIKINTTEINAAETAGIIKERFGLPGYG
tara:strand:- start:2112 stop:2336 length:225 start_codon:yes stop_codon:yes gene_type:complete